VYGCGRGRTLYQGFDQQIIRARHELQKLKVVLGVGGIRVGAVLGGNLRRTAAGERASNSTVLLNEVIRGSIGAIAFSNELQGRSNVKGAVVTVNRRA